MMVAYRLLLRLLPSTFRRRYGAAMEEAFGHSYAEASSRGLGAAGWLLVREAMDLMRTGARLRLRASGPGVHMKMRTRRRRGGPIPAIADDIVFAVRSVTRHAAFFAFAALTLGFGVGATTAMYSALKAVVLEPPAYAGGERAVKLWRRLGAGMRATPTADQVELATAQTMLFEAATTYAGGEVTVTGLGEPVKLTVLRGSEELASFMDMQPVVGRMFRADELREDGADVVLLSYGLWRSRFGGRANVPGETLHVNGRPWTIVGVLPADAVRPDGLSEPVDLWIPLSDDAGGRQFIARLAEGVTIQHADERLNALANADDESGLMLSPAAELRFSALQEPLRILMIAVTLLLLVACVNVSNLLLHWNAARSRDTAVRAALGASRARLVRHSLAESLLLALCGGAAGLAIAWAGTAAVAAMRPADLAALQSVRVDRGVLLFSLGVSLGAWLLFSLLPALRSSHPDSAASLSSAARSGGGGSARLRWTLVGLEVALSFMLLVGAATLIANVRESAARDTGYEPAAFVALDVTLPAWKHAGEAHRRAAFDQLIESMQRVPGVEAVALAGGVPPWWGITFGTVQVEGRAADAEPTVFHGGPIDEAYLRVIGQPLVSGRSFLPQEVRDGSNVVILGEAAAHRIFNGEDAVGRRFGMNGNEHTVVGVARDIAIVGMSQSDPRPIAYWPMPDVWDQMQILVRTARSDDELIAQLTGVVRTMEADALVEVASGAELLGESLARERFTASLLTTFAAVALLLSAIGLYGVLSQIVTGRTHEIGLRVALGADRARIRTLVLGTGARVVAVGLVAGTILVATGLKLLGSSVFGVGQRGIGVYVAAAVVLGITSLVAMWRPAAHAARIDPMRAMASD